MSARNRQRNRHSPNARFSHSAATSARAFCLHRKAQEILSAGGETRHCGKHPHSLAARKLQKKKILRGASIGAKSAIPPVRF
jgi:hypothetical protein